MVARQQQKSDTCKNYDTIMSDELLHFSDFFHVLVSLNTASVEVQMIVIKWDTVGPNRCLEAIFENFYTFC